MFSQLGLRLAETLLVPQPAVFDGCDASAATPRPMRRVSSVRSREHALLTRRGGTLQKAVLYWGVYDQCGTAGSAHA